jgi:DNA-binding CsgD family transcriptional regulator
MSCTPYAALDLQRQRHLEVASKRQGLRLIIIDAKCRVLFDCIGPAEEEFRDLLSHDRRRLRGQFGPIARELIEECERSGQRQSRVAFLDANRVVRVTCLEGRDDPMFAITLEFFRGGDSLSRAARKYQLTEREMDVLAMILEGRSATETAQALQLAETTVQGYYKRLLSKTQSRNRPAMVANVLGWGGSNRP